MRITSGDISVKNSSYEAQNRGNKESPSINWLVLSPKSTMDKYPSLNPIFHVNHKKSRFVHIGIPSSMKITSQESSYRESIAGGECIYSSEKKSKRGMHCASNKRVIRRVTNMIMNQKSKSDRKVLEFSFGRN